MPLSLNACFVGDRPSIEDGDKPGRFIVELLVAKLRDDRRSFSEPDLWRDSGWEVDCRAPAGDVTIVVLALPKDRGWMLQIAATRRAGLFGWLTGRKPSASPELILEVAEEVHAALVATGQFTELCWVWDGFPDESSGSTLPPVP